MGFKYCQGWKGFKFIVTLNAFTTIQADMSRLDDKVANLAVKVTNLDTKIVAIETNHFAHLKNFLTELTSILLDKGVINNTDKARLDNELRGM